MPDRPDTILIVTDAWEPQTNGVVTTLKNVIRELQTGRTCSVEVIHPGLFDCRPLPSYPEIRIVRNPWRLRHMVRKMRPAAIHVATEGPLGLVARRFLVRHGMPFTTSLHTKFPEYVRERTRVPLAVGYAYLRWFHKPAARTLVTTESHRRELNQWGLRNLVVWGRGVDTEQFRPLPRTPRTRRKLLYVGRVAVEKNVEAFLNLDVDAHKIVVGDGPARARLQRRYPGAEWVGFRHGAELAAFYADADVFVFPSRTDTFGLVMLEAMATGTPVAAYPVTGPRDIVRDGVNGALCDDLHVAVDRALRVNRHDCRQFALRNSWSYVADRLVEQLSGAG